MMSIRLVLVVIVFLPFIVHADDDSIRPASQSKVYQAECASCHMAYQPGLLPSQSWLQIMHNLPNHYGTDASLDTETILEISTWLQTNAGTYKRVSEEPQDNRITESSWFKRKHRKIDNDVWLRPLIKSPSNCMACHTTANQGNYDDDFVRIPK